MVAVTKLALGLSAVAGVLAAPAEYGPAVEPRDATFVLGEDHPLFLARKAANLTMLLGRSNSNYVQKYTTGGTVNFQTGTNTFTLSYNVQQDFVVGVGWNPGGTAAISHSGSFTVSSGLGSLGIYGWTTNPLVEYYIMDCNHGISTGGTQKGSVTSDGATYAIWEHQQVNQPSIQGTSTFNQYISIRNSCTSSGTITVQNHFNAWKNYGMNLGTMNFQVIAVESWSGSGSASQTISNTATGSTSPSPPPPASSSSPPPPSSTGGGSSSGSCSAQWGQCGGIGWSGPTCCASGYTCHVGNSYYSQCY